MENATQLERAALEAIVNYFAFGEERTLLSRFSLARLRPDLCGCLEDEARVQRAAAFRRNRAFCSAPGNAVARWLDAPEIRAELNAFGLTPSGKATYLYYEQVGDCVLPHVDVPEFRYNLLLFLGAGRGRRNSSRLGVIGRDLKPIELDLNAGDCVLFSAGHYFHYRTPLGPGDSAMVLTTGLSASACPDRRSVLATASVCQPSSAAC
jgi:hypothetical protein